MQKRVQLKDIAKKANISIAMVSYVLNGKHTDRINEKTAQRIKNIAKDLNYKPNRLAQSLKTNRTQNIGLILPDLTNQYFSQLSRIIESELKKHGYTVFIGSVDEDKVKFREMIDTFSERNVDGLIVLPVEESSQEISKIHKSEIPYVLIDRYYPDYEFNYVINDNYYGSYQLVKYLADKGKQSIGLITMNYQMAHIDDRNSGFIDACDELGIVNSCVREVELSDLGKSVYKAMNDLLKTKKPCLDAIILGADLLALYGLSYAVKNHMNIPKDLELVAFDEAEYYNIFPSQITYYRQPIEAIGQQAVRFLIDEICNPGTMTIHENVKGDIRTT